jgi:hypothetical protein
MTGFPSAGCNCRHGNDAHPEPGRRAGRPIWHQRGLHIADLLGADAGDI